MRRLTKRLWAEGYQVWLDEKELVPGDALAIRLSDALEASRVIIVVVTPDSVNSKWLSFELNKATERMVDGSCRIIPVLRGDVEMPPELKGLIYADFRSSFAQGFKSVVASLEREADEAIRGTWSELEAIVEEAFDGSGCGSLEGEYDSMDFSCLLLDGLMDFAGGRRVDEASILYEIEHDYTGKQKPLTESWWSEYIAAQDNFPDTFRLLVTERPVGFSRVQQSEKSVAVSRFVHYRDTYPNPLAVVIVDLSSATTSGERRTLVEIARDEIKDLAVRLGMPTAGSTDRQSL